MEKKKKKQEREKVTGREKKIDRNMHAAEGKTFKNHSEGNGKLNQPMPL